jgi:hypothetical protein
MCPRGRYEIAQGDLSSLAKGTQSVEVGVIAIPLWPTLECPDIIDDVCYGVHNGLHWRQNTSRGIGAASREEAVDC